MCVAETISRTGSSATGASACGLKLERGRARPGALHHDVLEAIVHELADARASVDMRDDLQQIIRRFAKASATGVESSALCL